MVSMEISTVWFILLFSVVRIFSIVKSENSPCNSTNFLSNFTGMVRKVFGQNCSKPRCCDGDNYGLASAHKIFDDIFIQFDKNSVIKRLRKNVLGSFLKTWNNQGCTSTNSQLKSIIGHLETNCKEEGLKGSINENSVYVADQMGNNSVNSSEFESTENSKVNTILAETLTPLLILLLILTCCLWCCCTKERKEKVKRRVEAIKYHMGFSQFKTPIIRTPNNTTVRVVAADRTTSMQNSLQSRPSNFQLPEDPQAMYKDYINRHPARFAANGM